MSQSETAGFTTTVTYATGYGFDRSVTARVRLTDGGELLLPWRKFMDILCAPSDRYRFARIDGDVAVFERIVTREGHLSPWRLPSAEITMPAADVSRVVERLGVAA